MFKPLPVLIESSSIRLTVYSGIITIILAISLLLVLFFLLFPFLHRMGLRGVIGSILVFSLTYTTEYLIMWILGGTLDVFAQPIGIITPIIAAIVSWIAQDKYGKIVKKQFSPVHQLHQAR